MLIVVTTDHNIDGSDDLSRYVATRVETRLSQFAEDLTRIDVHLSVEAAGHTRVDANRCVISALVPGAAPVVATDNADSIEVSLTGALNKLEPVLGNHRDRLKDGNRRESIRHPSASNSPGS